MPLTKRIVVLANSIKKQARCIAGIEVGSGRELDPAGWVRPVSDESEGELRPRHMQVNGGGVLNVLEIVDVPLLHGADDRVHPEDWIIDLDRKWERKARFDTAALGDLEEEPLDLWLESTSRTDRVRPAFLSNREAHQSLYLIRPANLRLRLWTEFNQFKGRDQKKSRAVFDYNGWGYSLSLTDPVATDRYCRQFPAVDEQPREFPLACGDRCLLCVSLTPEFNGYHYKVVATVLQLP